MSADLTFKVDGRVLKRRMSQADWDIIALIKGELPDAVYTVFGGSKVDI